MKEERKKTDKLNEERPAGGAPAAPDDLAEIDPVDFLDPEEFDYRRRGSHAPSR
jgi:hypothetical protein